MLGVRLFRNIVFILTAFLLLSVSAHCHLEFVPGFEGLRCSGESSSSPKSGKDCSDCCAVEKSQYRPEQIRLDIPTPEHLPLVRVPVLPVAHTLAIEVSLGILTAAPPELSQCWHFLFRTVLPSRAPSIAS